MSGDIDRLVPESGSLERGRFTYFPVVPGRLEFAVEVRQAILEQRPQVVALELPATLQHAWLRAVERLPEMSVIFYPDEGEEEDTAVYVPVEPADPFTEAIRTALEIGAEVRLRGSRCGRAAAPEGPLPGPLLALPRSASRSTWRPTGLFPQPRSEEIALHADGIAWKLQGADPLARVMVVVSLNLLDPVLDAMEQPQAQPMAPLRREGVQVLNPHPESLAEITLDYPYLQWRYEQFRDDLRDLKLIDRRQAQLALYREAEKSYEANTGETLPHWQRLHAGALHAQPGAGGPPAHRRTVRPDRGRARRGGRQLRLGGLGDRRQVPAAERSRPT